MNSVALESPLEPQNNGAATKSFLALAAERAFPVPEDHDSTPWTPDGTPHAATGRSRLETSFCQEVQDELERTNPDLLTWLKSTRGLLFQGMLILGYIAVETVGALLNSFALKPNPPPKFKPIPSSMTVMNAGLSIIIGLLITAGSIVCSERTGVARLIPKTFVAVFDLRNIVSFAFIATLFSVSNVFAMMAYSSIDAGLKKILDQLRLPLTAGMGTVLIGKRYCMHEWLALLIVLLAVISFYIAYVEHDEVTELHTKCRYPSSCFSEASYDVCAIRVDGPTITGTAIQDERNVNGTQHDITTFDVKAMKTDASGLVFSVTGTFFNCVGSLLSERAMKRTASTPFPAQKVQMELTGLPVAMLMSFIVPLWIQPNGGKAIWWSKNEAEGSGAGFFQGYNGLTFIAISMQILISWMGGIIVKQFSSLVKVLAKCFVLLLTILCSGTFLKACQADPIPPTMYALAFIVTAASMLFATMPKAKAADAPH